MPHRTKFRLPNFQFEFTKLAGNADDLPRLAKSVLIALSDGVDQYGFTYPGYQTLALRTGYSVKSVSRAMTQLEASGYIRRTRTRRGNGQDGVYGYALILTTGHPTGHYAQTIGHLIPEPTDTVSALNKPIEHINKQTGRLLVLRFEEHALRQLAPIIDLSAQRDLICLGALSQWLFNEHAADGFSEALRTTLTALDEFKLEYLSQHRRLGSWKEAVAYLKKRPPVRRQLQESNELPPFLQQVFKCLPASEQAQVRSRNNLSSIRAREEGSVVFLSSDAAYALDYLRNTHPGAYEEAAIKRAVKVKFE